MKTCCVIGGNGFIGRTLLPILQTSGRRVIVLSRSIPRQEDQLSEVTYWQGDYGDQNLLTTLLNDVEEVILLAYASVPKTSFENPMADLAENLPRALTLFEVAKQTAVKKIIYTSSGGTVYGHAAVLPISEEHPTNPISPYGITKLATEKYAGMYHTLYQVPVVTVRPANAYGESQRPYTGQGFVATAIASILQEKKLAVYGGPEGTVRDYLHVEDLAHGIIQALDYGEAGQVYNLGSGIGTSTVEILTYLTPLAQQAGKVIQTTFLPARPFDVPSNILSPSKATQKLHWHAKIPLTQGLERVWNHLSTII